MAFPAAEAGFLVGARVRAKSRLGIMRERGWRSKFYGEVPEGTLGTVIRLDEPLTPFMVDQGWFPVRFDGFERVPDDDQVHGGDALFCTAHEQFVELV